MLTIIEPRSDIKLVSLDAVKAELQIVSDETDEYLSGVIDRASEMVETHCRRVFAVEGVSQTVQIDRGTYAVELARYPVIGMTSVTEDGEVLEGEAYRLNAEAGLLFRRRDGVDSCWTAREVIIAYSAGYENIPGRVQDAIFEIVKAARAARTRDPALRSENILEGLYSYQRFNSTDLAGGMPPNVASMLDPFVNHVVA